MIKSVMAHILNYGTVIVVFLCCTKIESDAITFMIGGFQNIGYLIAWLLWHLANNREIQQKLREELERETGGEVGKRLRDYARNVSTTYST